MRDEPSVKYRLHGICVQCMKQIDEGYNRPLMIEVMGECVNEKIETALPIAWDQAIVKTVSEVLCI